jgi:hypothetical protein
VIAIAGGPEKCCWLENELGVDLALDYKSSDFHERFKKEAGFVDVYFDNVGGEILNFVMTRMNRKGRIVICGMCFVLLLFASTLSDLLNEAPSRITVMDPY